MYHQDTEERDELRARFTVWLDTLIRHAKLNYLRKQNMDIKLISLEGLDESATGLYVEDIYMSELSDEDFVFEEERLAAAFSELPLLRQQILKMLFVDEMKVGEIAKELNCSPKYISNQRLKGLAFLRKQLDEGGEKDE